MAGKKTGQEKAKQKTRLIGKVGKYLGSMILYPLIGQISYYWRKNRNSCSKSRSTLNKRQKELEYTVIPHIPGFAF